MPNNACQVQEVPDEMALPHPKATGNTKNIKKENKNTNQQKEKASADTSLLKVMRSYEQPQLILMT